MPHVVPLGAAYPSPENLPTAQLNRILASVARRAGGRGISYDMPPGAESLRRQIAKRALDAGCDLSPDDIITTCGGTEALLLCLRALTRTGDVVAVESPSYFAILQVIEQLGLRAVEIPMHPRDGMDLEVLERAAKTKRLAACIAIPNFNNPLGSVMPDAHKQRLVELLARFEVPLIEDDINGELIHEGPRPRVARAFDRNGLVLLCGSFSKTVAPGYRVGWVVPGQYYERVKAMKLTTTLATATLPQLAMAEFLAHGGYNHHLRSLRSNFARQVQQMSEAITDAFPEAIKLSRPTGGFVLWVELPKGVSALALHERALAADISVAPGPMFSARQGFQNFIRLSCGHPWSSRTAKAVEVLGRITRQLM